MVTLKDISAKCKCSVATVSKALNGMPDIGEETARHIRQVATQMGYTPNAAARTLKTNRSQTIGLLMCQRDENIWTHDFFSRVAAGIQEVMEGSGYDVTPINSLRLHTAGELLQYCVYRRYDGIIIMSAGFRQEEMREILESKLPMISIENTFPGRGAVLSDNMQGTGELVRLAYEKGHRKIAFIHGEDTSVTRTRLQSFRAVCSELELSIPEAYLRPALYHDRKSAAREAKALLALEETPTCILFQDDYSCIGGLDLLRRDGVTLPENLSYAGYDGIKLAQLFTPRLTTYRQDISVMGQEAARMLLEAIEKPQDFLPRYVTIPGRLVEGESVRSL